MRENGKEKKRIFISDLHLGDDKSLHPPDGLHPYGWLYPPRTCMLKAFLDSVREDPAAGELIILGDLLDQWVCPTGYASPDYDRVADADQNKGIMASLKRIDGDPGIQLVYVPGNHDMLLQKDFLTARFPHIRFLGTGPGTGVYKSPDGCITAEHGSMYSLFCSPDTWDHPGGSLPLGYFISRVVAWKNADQGDGTNFLDILEKFVKDYINDPDPALAKEIFEAIAGDAGLTGNSPIAMDELDRFPPSATVDQVAEMFARLFVSWGKNNPAGLSSLDGLISEVAGLQHAAYEVYHKTRQARIVVFGHTHHPLLDGYLGEKPFPDSLEGILPCDFIYANSGTWINGHDECTYIETEADPDQGQHNVRLCRYLDSGKKELLKERFVSLK